MVGKRSRPKARVIAGYLISAACLSVFLWRSDWERILDAFRDVSLAPIIGAVLMMTFCYLFFAMRWKALLPRGGARADIRRLFFFLMMGYTANAVFPLRPGDVARAWMVQRTWNTGLGVALSGILLERVFDVLTLILFGIAISSRAALPSGIIASLWLFGSAAVASLVALVILSNNRSSAIRIFDRSIGRMFKNRAPTVREHLAGFIEALAIIRPTDHSGLARLVQIAFLSALGWALCAFAVWLCLVAFDRSLPFESGVLVTVATSLGAAIPSSPAGIGVFHALAVLALSPWHVGWDQAIAIATVCHAVIVGVQLSLGILSSVATHSPLGIGPAS